MKSGVEVEILSSQYWKISAGNGYTDLETEEGIVTSCKGETYIVTVTDPTVTEYIHSQLDTDIEYIFVSYRKYHQNYNMGTGHQF